MVFHSLSSTLSLEYNKGHLKVIARSEVKVENRGARYFSVNLGAQKFPGTEGVNR